MTERRGIDWTAGEGPPGRSAIDIFWSSKTWQPTTVIALVLSIVAVLVGVFIIYRGYFGNVDARVERGLVIALLEIYTFLKFPLGRKNWQQKLNWLFAVDLLLILLVVGGLWHTIYNATVSPTRDVTVTLLANEYRLDYIVGVTVLLLLFEATRRAFGWIMVSIPLVFIIYSLTGSYWPGAFKAGQVSWTYLTEMLYVQNEGIFGVGVQVLIDMVFLYVLFGTFIKDTKIGAFFMAAASALAGRFAGGPAKVAIISSAFFGTISGSAIANVATTGVITIPMMKSVGYKPEFAASVETCASTAGYFTPPIMGAAAFLIAAFLGVSYFQVVIYAAVPAALYYVALFTQVHFRAKRDGISGLPADQVPSMRRVMAQGGHLSIPLIIIIMTLALGFSVTRAAVWGILSAIVVSLLRSETRLTPRNMVRIFENTLSDTVGVCIVMVITGVIQGSLMITGLGIRLSLLVQSVAMGSMILGLLVAAVVALVLGTGLPTILVYYISTAFVIPALEGMGANNVSVHIFALIFGSMAMITPPVCVAAFTAAAIAGSPPMKTGLTATRLGFAGYLVPFLAVFNPALVLAAGSMGVDLILVSIIIAVIGVAVIAASFEGYLLTSAGAIERILLAVSGLSLIAFQYFTGRNVTGYSVFFVVLGLALLATVLLTQKFSRRVARPATVLSPPPETGTRETSYEK